MPNFFDIANIIPRKGITTRRVERIKREGSPPYVWTVPVIASGASIAIYVPDQFPQSRKYQPLDSMKVTNNESTCDLTIVINGNDSDLYPAGTIITVHGSGVALWHIKVTNNGAVATSLGAIIIRLQKEALTTDKWVREKL